MPNTLLFGDAKNQDEEMLNRWSPETNTCYNKEYGSFIEGFFSQFHDSLFYALVLQFLIVTLMYKNIGSGIYWKVLFYASFAGLLGTLSENGTVAYICRASEKENFDNGNKDSSMHFILLLVDEIFWIISEYAIPYLNLIKMKAFAEGKTAIVVRGTIYILLIPFVIVRFMIGYTRMKHGYLSDSHIQQYHGYAFGVMGIADLICTFAILYFVKKNNRKANSDTNLNHYVKHSSYTILVCVDVVSCVLSFLNIFVTVSGGNDILKNVIIPFHCLKSSFVLILAVDALLFKYGANMNSHNEVSSGANSKNNIRKTSFGNRMSNKPYGGNSSFILDMSNTGDLKIKTNFNNNSMTEHNNHSPVNTSFGKMSSDKTSLIRNTNPGKKSNVSNIASYNYATYDKDYENNINFFLL